MLLAKMAIGQSGFHITLAAATAISVNYNNSIGMASVSLSVTPCISDPQQPQHRVQRVFRSDCPRADALLFF